LFYLGGPRTQEGKSKWPWRRNAQQFACWALGRTGYPVIDAHMQELLLTGFMSNRGRQNVASFLTQNLGVDWRLGAEHFEAVLVDYDCYANWVSAVSAGEACCAS
jgi:deoxyribodipyrimidine photo-lyase